MRILFMGTPQFSCPFLKALIQNEYDVIGVVTQPDRARGRGRSLQFSPVKELALECNIPVYQPLSLKKDIFLSIWDNLSPELVVVVAYGLILPSWVIHAPFYGCINAHASLLPKYRGAAPINWAIIDGEEDTGITIILMDEGMDTGDILLKRELRIDSNDTAITLSDKSSKLGASMLPETIKGIVEGKLKPIPQQNQQATFTTKLTKQMGLISWEKEAVIINRLIKALLPWPGCYTFLDGLRIKILQSSVFECTFDESSLPGQIIELDLHRGLLVRAGEGALQIREVQPANKKRMDIRAFASGWRHDLVGRSFSSSSEQV